MDDLFERPSAISTLKDEGDRAEEDGDSSGEDDNMDWSKLPSISRPIIPKRGEKDFEPTIHGGSGLQRHVLDRKRRAMLDALGVERNTSSKSISYGIWYPAISRAHVTVARGIHFTTMGHAVVRSEEENAKQKQKVAKRLELLPEEALYLVERGAMFAWKAVAGVHVDRQQGLEDMEGVPMTVQQAFTEMIGTEDLTLEKYQVYAYLKRLGYVVTRTKPPSASYPCAAPFEIALNSSPSIWRRVWNLASTILTAFLRIFIRRFDWWRPIQHRSWLHHDLNYTSVFKSLRFIPSGHSTPPRIQLPQSSSPSPYEIFYNLYKPATPFKKTSPPAPDFSVVVVNARTTPMPTLAELSTLFGALPELPPPQPRKRMSYAEQRATKFVETTDPVVPRSGTFLHRLFSLIYPISNQARLSPIPARKPNPFAVLKSGKKLVIIAAVDAGTISFFGFRQGVFEEFPMM